MHGDVEAKCVTGNDDLAAGVIVDLEPAENNETVARGLIKIIVGPHKDKIVRFTRAKTKLFGMKLDKADLLYVVRPFDRVWCELSGIGDYPQVNSSYFFNI